LGTEGKCTSKLSHQKKDYHGEKSPSIVCQRGPNLWAATKKKWLGGGKQFLDHQKGGEGETSTRQDERKERKIQTEEQVERTREQGKSH